MSVEKLVQKEDSLTTSESEINEIFKISAEFSPKTLNKTSHDTYILSIEQTLKTLIPKDIWPKEKNKESLKSFYQTLEKLLPVISTSDLSPAPSCFSFTTICNGEFTFGIGRFIAEMLSQWLIPGKQLTITANRSLCFLFKNFSKTKFFFCEYDICFHNKKEMEIIQKNISAFIKEIRLSILSVYHARYVLSMKKAPQEQKNSMIQENILNLLNNRKSTDEHHKLNQMQNVLLKLSAEKKLSEIEKNLAYIMHKKPKTFNRDIFSSIHNMIFLFKEDFTAIRDPKHISRIIGFQYLFRKIIYQDIRNEPNKRHLNLKFLKTQLNDNGKPRVVLGILITLNFVNETERFEKNHILEAIWYCIQDVQYVENSYIVDKRDEKVRLFYLEIENPDTCFFSLEKTKLLKKRLPQEFKNRIENTVHPIFMPRNEEEILRNIILLSKQLKYVKDIPQVIISYDKQTGMNISFNVILVRLLKSKSISLRKTFSETKSFLKFGFDEIKKVGYLKRKYTKEANLFKVILNKNGFFRQDKSLDLLKARQCVARELSNTIGDFRDYNGGMILKQSQAFTDLKNLYPDLKKKNEVLLENFFYSLRPGVMQSILPSIVIDKLFSLLVSVIHKNFEENCFIKKTLFFENYLLICLATSSFKSKEKVINCINKLKIPSFELTQFFLEVNKIKTIGYAYRTSDTQKKEDFIKSLDEIMEKEKVKL
jgi:hypothetical protein